MPRYVQDRATGKLVEVPRVRVHVSDAPVVVGDIEPFVSPVDHSIITGRRSLRDHQKAHGVAQHGEYGEDNGRAYFERADRQRHERRTFNTREDRESRRQLIARALDEQRRR